ncbi:hypothetical protein FZI91_04500 [Mycobacterium sp. CBMA271]|uniref:hypothetical protein n=1 Tax=unclassified Mycobacteroides TaxID=2618759 RepID=UPI0012DFB8AF|nr:MULTISPECIES: hypothetical protein [unclassified Mycobacteroides]MUM19881.1 hypothetical protein [Mycobacteroides sp. CBMA 326]MUM20961.1 hypothetical protein [Mycobacteroides sp. CBMA 271]
MAGPRSRGAVQRFGLLVMTIAMPVAGFSWSSDAVAEAEHVVRYVVTADAGREITVHFRVAPQTESWSGVHSENYWVSPAEPWEQVVALEDPGSAYVSVRNIWWNPNLRCEIWVDGKRTMESSGVCIPRPVEVR